MIQDESGCCHSFDSVIHYVCPGFVTAPPKDAPIHYESDH